MRRSVAHVFVSDLAQPLLDSDDFHHLSRVLRLRPGEIVTASDGLGCVLACTWAGTAELEVSGSIEHEPSPSPAITIGFALTKGDRPEQAVQRLTEAGVDRIAVMVTERSVVHWKPGSEARHMARLKDVARHAAMQSRRAWLPVVEGVFSFAELVQAAGLGAGSEAAGGAGLGGGAAPGGPAASEGGASDPRVALAAPGGLSPTLSTPTVLVGPEGGWSDTELAAVPASRHISLGPHVLRAETAAMAAGVLLSGLRAGLVLPASV